MNVLPGSLATRAWAWEPAVLVPGWSDLVLGQSTERTELETVRTKPFPFPPKPTRWAAVELTRAAIRRADRRQGKRGLWLSLLDRVGVRFDS